MPEFQSQKTLLVTGAGGRIGRLIRRAFQAESPPGVKMVFLSRNTGADISWTPGQSTASLPVCDVIVAVWGITSGTPAALAGNSRLARESLKLAEICGAKRVLHFSSAAVYGMGIALHETHPCTPATAYGAAKLAMEQEIARFPDSIRHCCLRLANVVGADSLASGLRAPGHITLDRFENGHGPLRSYMSPSDLMRVICRLGILPARSLPSALNIAAPHPVAMADLARAAIRPFKWRKAPGDAIQCVSLDAGSMTRLLPGTVQHKTAPDMIRDWQSLRPSDASR